MTHGLSRGARGGRYFADRTYDFNGPAYTIDFKWFF